MRRCTKCGIEKSLDAFHRTRRVVRDGRVSRCKACVAAHDRDTFEQGRERKRRWYEQNRAKTIARAKEWKRANRDRLNEAARRSYIADHERHTANRQRWAEKNREATRAKNAQWRAANPEALRRGTQRYRARKFAAHVVDVDMRALYERDCGFCGICGDALAFEAATLDHFIPLIRGGTHEPANCQVAHLRCNQRKNAKMPSADEVASFARYVAAATYVPR